MVQCFSMIRKGPILSGLIGAVVAGGALLALRWTVFSPKENVPSMRADNSSSAEPGPVKPTDPTAEIPATKPARSPGEKTFKIPPPVYERRTVSPEAMADYQRIRKQIREGDFLPAEKACRELLDANPGFLAARETLARLCQKQGKLADARRQWRELIDRVEADLSADRGDREALEGLLLDATPMFGEVLMDLENYPEAMHVFARAAGLAPTEAIRWKNFAASALAAGSAGRALVALDRAEKLSPKDPDIFLQRGNVHLAIYRERKGKEHLSLAVRAWRQSLKLNPEQEELRDKTKIYQGILDQPS